MIIFCVTDFLFVWLYSFYSFTNVHCNIIPREKTEINIINPPREGKPLLVLDLDHTLLDFSSKVIQNDVSSNRQSVANAMKRPYMDQFLTAVYQHYDLVVWSQTSWRWLETKLIELQMLANPGYKFCFVLDKTSMFTITSTKRDGTSVTHHVRNNKTQKKLLVLSKKSNLKCWSRIFYYFLVKLIDFFFAFPYFQFSKVKPLQLIWSKFNRWSSKNTVHIE